MTFWLFPHYCMSGGESLGFMAFEGHGIRMIGC